MKKAASPRGSSRRNPAETRLELRYWGVVLGLVGAFAPEFGVAPVAGLLPDVEVVLVGFVSTGLGLSLIHI